MKSRPSLNILYLANIFPNTLANSCLLISILLMTPCCSKKEILPLNQTNIEMLMHYISADKEAFDVNNYFNFRQTLFLLEDLNHTSPKVALRMYTDDPSLESQVITIVENMGQISVEKRTCKLKTDVLFGDLFHGFQTYEDLVGVEVKRWSVSKSQPLLSKLIHKFEIMQLASSKDISGRPIVLDGTCYYFEILSADKFHKVSYCNPMSGATKEDDHVLEIIQTIESWLRP